jgi:hypothetical protein
MNEMLLELRGVVSGAVDGVLDRVWTSREVLSFGDWCEKNIILTNSENSDYAGPYSREMTQSVCRFMEVFADEGRGRKWRKCFGMKSSQSTVTAHALMMMAKSAVERPGNVVYGIDSKGNAESVAARFVDFLWGVPEMRETLRNLPEHCLKGETIQLPGMTVWFVGAGSVGQMASKPGVVLVVVDEVDNHRVPKKEGQTLHLLGSRGKATMSGKQFGFSKPTDEDGQIFGAYETGTKHKDFLPCPECGEFQVLELGQLRYKHLRDEFGELDLERVRRETYYECGHCAAAIPEEKKAWMLERGEARATNYREEERDGKTVRVPGWLPGVMSFHYSDLYAMWEGSRWGDLAVEKIAAGRNPVKLKGFIQDRLGEPWKEGVSRRVSAEMMRDLCGDWRRGEFPKPAVLAGVFADTQDDRWVAVKVGYSREGDVMVSDWGDFLTWKNLVAWARAGAMGVDGRKVAVRCNLTDEGGHRTFEVRQNCARLSPLFNPSKGLGGMQNQRNGGELLSWRPCRVFKKEEQGNQLVKVLHYDDDAYRRMLYRTFILDRDAVDENGEPLERFGELMLPVDAAADEDFLDGFCHEWQVRKNGRTSWESEPGNDIGDCVKMAIIGRDLWARRFMNQIDGGRG